MKKETLQDIQEDTLIAYREAVDKTGDVIHELIEELCKRADADMFVLENAMFNNFISLAYTNAQHSDIDAREYMQRRFDEFLKHYDTGQVTWRDDKTPVEQPQAPADDDDHAVAQDIKAVLGAIGHMRRTKTDT